MKTVLIVEDNLQLAAHWIALLEEEGLQVIHEVAAPAALNCLKTTEIDLVISDMVLSEASEAPSSHGGLLILSFIALNFDVPPKMLAVSGFDAKSEFAETFKLLDSSNVLLKPVPDNILLTRVHALLAEQDHEIEQRERELVQRELQQTQFATDNAPYGVFWVGKDASIQYANHRAEEMLGYSRRELCQMHVADINLSFPMATWEAAWEQWKQPGCWRIATVHRRRDGSTYESEVTIAYLSFDDEEFLLASFQDVTQQVAEQKELARTRQQLQMAISGGAVGLWDWDLRSNDVYFSPEWHLQIGEEPDSLNGLAAWRDRVHSEDLERTMELVHNYLEGNSSEYRAEYRFRHANGTYLHILSVGEAIRNANSTAVRFTGTHTDVTELKTIQNEVVELSEQRRAMVELLGNSDGVWDWKVGSQEAEYAPGFRKIMGFASDDQANFPNTLDAFESRFHPEDKDHFWKAVTSCFETQVPLVHEFRVRRQDGKYIWIRSRASASFDGSGNAVRLVGSIYDITEQKNVEEERDRFLNAAVELFAIVNLDSMTWSKLSSTWTSTLGYDRNEMIEEMSIVDIHPPDEHDAIREHVARLKNGKPIRGWILRTYHKNGDLRHTEWNIDPPLAGESIVYAAGRDVTELRQYKLLREYMTQVEQHSFELESINAQLSRSNQDLIQFAYVASHDLQEPLRAIGGFLQLLQDRYSEQLDERAIGYIGKSVDGAARMNQLINDLLHYSQVTRDESEFVPVDLTQCVKIACDELGQLIEKTGAEIRVAPLPTINGIQPLLVQLFQNLIGNAIKYRGEETPRIEISKDSDGSTLLVHVQDNGIGIASEYQEQVFTLFKRLHHREEHSGTGIGLAICQRVAARHGGSITVKSKEGEGSRFTVRFSVPNLGSQNLEVLDGLVSR